MVFQVSCAATLAFVARRDRFLIKKKSRYCDLPGLETLKIRLGSGRWCVFTPWCVVTCLHLKSKEVLPVWVEHTTGNNSNNGPLQSIQLSLGHGSGGSHVLLLSPAPAHT